MSILGYENNKCPNNYRIIREIESIFVLVPAILLTLIVFFQRFNQYT